MNELLKNLTDRIFITTKEEINTKIKAISRIGDINNCEFFDENNNILFYTDTKIKNGISNTYLFDKENNFLANISNAYNMKAKCTTLIRQLLQGEYIIDIIDDIYVRKEVVFN